VELLDGETGYLVEVRRGRWRRVLQGGISPLNDAMATHLATDKFHAAFLLERAGFRVPESARCLKPGWFTEEDFSDHTGLEHATQLAARHGFPLLIKPMRGSRGKNIHLVPDLPSLEAAVRDVWEKDYLALAQAVIPGIDVRLDLLDGDYLLGYTRRPVRLEGNGESTPRELLIALDIRFQDATFTDRLERDPLWRERAAGHTLDAPLPEGVVLDFATPILNLNRLCFAEPLDTLPEPWQETARAIGEALHLRHYGIDFKVENLEAGPENTTVIEVNASPSVVQMAKMGHRERAIAAEAKVMEAMLEL
jgi:glutathione synthase/RimK-type ligase-like ATP-grasp enzyme